MTRLMEIRKERGFPQTLGKAFGFPTFPHRLDDDGHSKRSNFQRQRSTLERPISCLKDGEYLRLLLINKPSRALFHE
jgi:hypothetical protein